MVFRGFLSDTRAQLTSARGEASLKLIYRQGLDIAAQAIAIAPGDRRAYLFAGAQEMEAGVLELRRVREQMALRLEAARETGADRVVDGGESLTERMEEWESRILQKYLETSQNNYMFEARLLVKFEDLLGRMSGANIPVTRGCGR